MPRPDSKKGIPITTSPFENPYETNLTRFGAKGANLLDQIDMIEQDEMTRMTNLTHRKDGGATVRSGQTVVNATAVGVNHHSMRRLNDPLVGSYTRVHGVDGSLYVGQNGPSVLVDSGYSGDPLTMVPYRPPFSAETWMFIADSARMRKVRTDGLDLPIGMSPPTVAATTSLDTFRSITIADMSVGPTNNWTPGFGETLDPVRTVFLNEFSTAADIPGGATSGHFRADTGLINNPGPVLTSAVGYVAAWFCAKTMDLSQFGAGLPVTDDDYIHLWLNFSHVEHIQEWRLYFVCSDNYTAGYVPGIPRPFGFDPSVPLDPNPNTDAYFHTFSGNDFAAFVQAQISQLDAAEFARQRSIKDTSLDTTALQKGEASIEAALAQGNYSKSAKDSLLERQRVIKAALIDASKTKSAQQVPGSDQWQEFGVLGVPIRRGDFQRIGTTAGRDWSTITGLVVMMKTTATTDMVVGTTEVRMGDVYLHGGSFPDTGEPDFIPYDYRYTHYDSRTGAEGNPSPIMATANFQDALRRGVNVGVTAYGDSAVRQRIYRRGGSLPTDWFFLGANSGDGSTYLDNISDQDAVAATTLEIDNDQPVTSVDAGGNTILNQPVPALWGPLDDLLMACGDPQRPGHVYFCKPGEPDSWPPDNTTEVCSPSEQLMMGCMYGGQSLVFSKERAYYLYPNFANGTAVTAAPTQCRRGLISRWGLAVGIGGIYFIHRDGVYRTVGGPEEKISRKIEPLFRGQTVNGYAPIDFTAVTAMRLELHENELFFQFQNTSGAKDVWVYSILYDFWRHYSFGVSPSSFYSDEGNQVSTLLIGGAGTGKTYTYSGLTDDGAAIVWLVRTGALTFGRPREEKRTGDQVLDLDANGTNITLQNFIDYETVANTAQTVSAIAGRTRAIFDDWGTTPQRIKTVSTHINGSSSAAPPVLYWLGTSVIIEPDITVNRVTQWDDLAHPDDSWSMGVTFDCDTGGQDRTIIIEGDFNGAIFTVATLTVNANGRHKLKFSWLGTRLNKIRIRPDDECKAWILYKADWLFQPEPPIISKWDVYWENAWDQYYTGLDLFCDTLGQPKTIEVYVDEVLVKTETVTTSGRLVHHITLPWGRGHVFRFRATDDNPGQLHDYRWHLQPEPSEQTNWNQNFTVAGMESDKYLKAIVFQCDTFGQNKTVTVECDGVVVETLTVNTNGRKVAEFSFPQHLGRVFRVYPTDDFPGRLYSLWWVFDQEPLALQRWETQEITHGVNAWHYPIYAHVTLKSFEDVDMEVIAYSQTGVATAKHYTIPNTNGVKIKAFVPFEAVKGILFKYIFTSDSQAYWLYREETTVQVRVWGADQTIDAKPFGNDDTDATRVMTRSEAAAARSGGTTG